MSRMRRRTIDAAASGGDDALARVDLLAGGLLAEEAHGDDGWGALLVRDETAMVEWTERPTWQGDIEVLGWACAHTTASQDTRQVSTLTLTHQSRTRGSAREWARERGRGGDARAIRGSQATEGAKTHTEATGGGSAPEENLLRLFLCLPLLCSPQRFRINLLSLLELSGFWLL